MKKYSYEIRQIDAWYNDEEGWWYNETWHIGEMRTSATDEKRAFTRWLARHTGIRFYKGKTLVTYDGDFYEIINRKTKEPLFAAIPINQ